MNTFQRLALLGLLLLGCSLSIFAQGIKGNGNIVRESRSIKGFTGVEANGVFHVHLTQGSSFSVEVETDENIMPHVTTKVKGNTLVLKTEKSIRKVNELTVFITLPELDHVEVSGAGEVVGESTFYTDHMRIGLSGAGEIDLAVNSAELTADLSGASELNLSGKADFATYELSGASDVDAGDLMSENGLVDLSGSSHLEVHLTKSMHVQASGASSVVCHGNPAEKTIQKSGASSVSMR